MRPDVAARQETPPAGRTTRSAGGVRTPGAALATTGRVHSWDVSTGVDGPGTRFVAFLAGCPLRCQFCHSPDTWYRRSGHPVTADDLMHSIRRYERFIKVAGGGVTLSGGEPLQQPAFAAEVLRRCHEMRLHTALDTSGFLGDRAELGNVGRAVHRRLETKHVGATDGNLRRGKQVGTFRDGPADENAIAINVHRLLWDTHQGDNWTLRRELRIPPILARFEWPGWFARRSALGVERGPVHRVGGGGEQRDSKCNGG